MKRSIKTRLISIVLSAALIIVGLPLAVIADGISELLDNDVTANDAVALGDESVNSEAINILTDTFEVTELREESVKHFRTEDGTYVAAQYDVPVHYMDANGEWQDIDNTLSESGSEYATNDAKIKFAKKITGNESLFTLHDDNRKITMILDGAIKKTQGVVIANESADESATKLQKMMALDKLSETIIYADILPGVDVEYVVQPYQVKENIIVKEKQNEYTYSFTIKLNNLDAILNDDGSVSIVDTENNELVYEVPAPVVFDSNNLYAPEGIASYTLTQTGNRYTLAVSVDAEWMNAKERTYPVTIDPTIYRGGRKLNQMRDTFVSSKNSSTAYGSQQGLFAGYSEEHGYTRAYVLLVNLPVLPANAYIVSANLNLEVKDNQICKDTYLGAYTIDLGTSTKWTESQMSWSSHSAQFADLLDYCKIEKNKLYTKCTWDVTEAAKQWYAETITNQGIAVGLLQENDTTENHIEFHSSESSSSTAPYLPFYSVTYKDTKGLEDYYSYFTASAGLAGTGSVNYATGALTFTKPLISTTDSVFPYTPTLVYNSMLRGNGYIYSKAQVAYSSNFAPFGWKLNIQETIIKKSYTSSTHTTAYYYIWADADGTEHYFHPVEGSSTIYQDEDGLLLTLNTSSSTQLTITDSAHTVRRFSKMTSTPSSDVLEAWFLRAIVDKNNNVISFGSDSNNNYRPTTVSLAPGGVNQIDFLSICYNSSGMPYLIWNPTSKEAVIFKYSATVTGSITSSGTKYLRQIVYAHGNANVSEQNWLNYYNNSTTTNITVDAICAYTYDSGGRLTSAKDNRSGSEIKYTYSSNKVATIQEYGNSSAGQKVGLTYGSGFTKLRNSGSDDSYGNSDDLYTVYSFDHEDRVINTYSTDLNSTQFFGGASGEYVSDNELAKNNIKTSVAVGGSFSNLIVNGGFEAGTTTEPLKYWTQTANVARSETFASGGGSYGAQFTVGNNTTDSIRQYVKLPAGDYNLSLSINTIGCENVTVTIQARSKNTTSRVFSEAIPTNENFASGGDIFGNLRFSAVNYNSTGYEVFEIIIEVSGSSVTDGTYVVVDNIMLQKGNSATSYNLVEFGNFEEFSVTSTGNAKVLRDEFWGSNNQYSTVTDSAFNAVMRIDGNVSSIEEFTQTLYTIPEAQRNNFLNNINYEALEGTFIISGFAKAFDALKSETGIFALRVDVTYCLIDGTSQKEQHYFHFNKSIENWQFVCGSFVAESKMFTIGVGANARQVYGIVSSIVVSGEYSYQPKGYAYFDNISVISSTDDSVTNYGYSGENGRLEVVQTGTFRQYYEYNSNNDLVRVAHDRGEFTDYSYDRYSNVIKETTYTFTSYSGQSKFYPFNDLSQITSITEKNSIAYEYNSCGQVTKQTLSSDNSKEIIATYEYATTDYPKIYGALISETDSLGREIKYFYDNTNGRLLASVNVGSGDGTYYKYDEIGNLIFVVPATYDLDGDYIPKEEDTQTEQYEKVSYSYNSRNFLSTITTKSTTYTFSYDNFGNTTSTSVGSQELASYTYNSYNGKIKKIEYGNGFVVRYVYDKLDNLSEVWYTNGGSETKAYVYTYTDSGQVARLDNLLTDKSTIYTYDASGKLIGYAECDTDSNTITHGVQFSYDEYSQVSHQTHTIDYLNGTAVDRHYYYYHYAYNDDGTLQKTSLELGDGYTGDRYTGSATYTYDAYNRLSGTVTNIKDFNNSSTYFKNTIGYTYTELNSLNRTSTQIATYSSQVNSNTKKTYTFTYDDNGNITSIKVNGTEQNRYKYDDIGQLVREDNVASGRTYVYSYDDAGNILTKDIYSITAANITPSSLISTMTYTYGNASWGDQLTKYNNISLTYDAIGNPLSYYNGLSYTFTWKNGRQLSTINGAATLSFEYNADGIRTSKTANGTEHIYHLNGSTIVAEEWGNKLLIYLYDASGSPVGMQYRTTSYAEGVFDTYWFEKNLQGDIVAVYSDAGTLLVTYTYDAWGYQLSTQYYNSGSGTAVQYNPFRYRGYYRDSETGFYYLNSRYYDPSTGRFINADGYVSTGQDLTGYNMYAYCGNNPVNRTDPIGQFWVTALIVTAVVVVCTGALSGCSSKSSSDYGAASSYIPSDSTEYNCYAYALGEDKWKYVGGSHDAVNDYSVSAVADMVLEDAKRDGRSIRPIDSFDSPISSNEYRIALRTSVDDYHFMKQHNDGTWSHKPGFCSTRLIDGQNPSVVSWDAPIVDSLLLRMGIIKEINVLKNYYDSDTIYFAVSK